jgi:small GTP-binding protein
MAFVNYNNREITAKIVYYGPALSGKTTCLKYLYNNKVLKTKSKLITLDTDGDRTLFFDFLPVEIGKVGNYSVKIQLYTVPGQVAYNTTRKMVLQGADGIVFVADSQKVQRKTNIESLQNLKKNLQANNLVFSEIPLVFQYNKRDLTDVMPVQELDRELNTSNKPYYPTVATVGENVVEAVNAIMKSVLIYLKNRLTIFQKDRTVLFSKDQLYTSPASKAAVSPDATLSKEDTSAEISQDDNLFELGSPVTQEKRNEFVTEQIDREDVDEVSDDIFDLKDYNMDSSDAPNNSELKDEDFFFPGEEKEEPSKVDPPSPSSAGRPEPVKVSKNIQVPVEVIIPPGKDEVRLDLTVKLIIKREK